MCGGHLCIGPCSTTLLCRHASAVKLVEIVAMKGEPLCLIYSDDSAEQLPVCVDIALAVGKLREAADCGMASSNTIASALETATTKQLTHCKNDLCSDINYNLIIFFFDIDINYN